MPRTYPAQRPATTTSMPSRCGRTPTRRRPSAPLARLRSLMGTDAPSRTGRIPTRSPRTRLCISRAMGSPRACRRARVCSACSRGASGWTGGMRACSGGEGGGARRWSGRPRVHRRRLSWERGASRRATARRSSRSSMVSKSSCTRSVYVSPVFDIARLTRTSSQVKPTDSLAGVALKYNVPLATLRRTNKLWSSDPIHLRSVLYIPVAVAVPKHTSQSQPQPQSRSQSQSHTHTQASPRPAFPHSESVPVPIISPSPPLLGPSASPDQSQLPTHDSAATLRATATATATANERRIVPADELSFFPPPKDSTALPFFPSPLPVSMAFPPLPADPPGRRHARTSTISALPHPASSLSASPSGSPRPHTLLDIFKSLPDVSALGRGPRSSLDSVSVSLGSRGEEREREEAAGAEVEVEMEMAVVGVRGGRRLNEPMKPSPGMIIQRGGARGDEAEEEDAWL
ncbi:carbohydrate-binding module family 50 protein [Calocera cornea HHB12733]|uniref:Carbohydrate-binding module family 50 protein n=1 Tax=Calocera cornea HHB12733 TaxID=1353952 RepID=A0A165JLI4_9BASI|nr:carbohydrate-binding module family 50 protein [Calocera cornea HHB12733]